MTISFGRCSICVCRTRKIYGGPSGQHWLFGSGNPAPLFEMSPNFRTVAAACDVRMGLLKSPTNVVLSRSPDGRRWIFSTGPGPLRGLSYAKELRPHMPEKSGTRLVV